MGFLFRRQKLWTASGLKASMQWSARDAFSTNVAAGLRASMAWTARDGGTVAGNHAAALKASMTWSARDGVGDTRSVLSIDPTTGALLGGTEVTITGTGFEEGCQVWFASEDPPSAEEATDVAVVGPTEITCITPAMTVSGARSVVVIWPPYGPSDLRHLDDGFVYQPLDLGVLPLSLYCVTPFSGSPWTSLHSGGLSNGRTLAEGTNPPTSTTIEGHDSASFDGVNDQLVASVKHSSLFSAGEGFVAMLIGPVSPAETALTDPFNDPGLFVNDTSGITVVLAFTSSGVRGAAHDGGWKYTDHVACSLGVWSAAFLWWDGSNLRCQVNRIASDPVACGNVTITDVDFPRVGVNYTASKNYKGHVRALLTSAEDCSAMIPSILDKWNVTYGLSL